MYKALFYHKQDIFVWGILGLYHIRLIEMLEKESSVFKSKINHDIITELIDIIPEEWRPKQKDIDELINYILYRVDNLDVIISTILAYNNR